MSTLTFTGDRAIAVRCIIDRRNAMTNAERAATPLTFDAAKILGNYADDLTYKVFGINKMIDHALTLHAKEEADLWDEIRGCIMQLPEIYVPIRERADKLGPPASVEVAWDVLKHSHDRRRRQQAIHKIMDVACLLEDSDRLWHQLGLFLMDSALAVDLTAPMLGRFAKYTSYKTMASWACRQMNRSPTPVSQLNTETPTEEAIAA